MKLERAYYGLRPVQPYLGTKPIGGEDPYTSEFDVDISTSARSMTFRVGATVQSEIVVDWGDGSAAETKSTDAWLTLSHVYPSQGSYTVKMTCSEGQHWTLGMGNTTFPYVYSYQFASPASALLAARIRKGFGNANNYAFYYFQNLKELELPDGMTRIGGNCFDDTGLACEITLPQSLRVLGNSAFLSCPGITGELRIPGGLDSIGSQVFAGAGVSKVVIEEGASIIGESMFAGCRSLVSVSIAKTVTSILAAAFLNDTSLASVVCEAVTPPTIAANSFEGVPATCPIYVPAASVTAYKTAQYWSARAAYIQAIPTT